MPSEKDQSEMPTQDTRETYANALRRHPFYSRRQQVASEVAGNRSNSSDFCLKPALPSAPTAHMTSNAEAVTLGVEQRKRRKPNASGETSAARESQTCPALTCPANTTHQHRTTEPDLVGVVRFERVLATPHANDEAPDSDTLSACQNQESRIPQAPTTCMPIRHHKQSLIGLLARLPARNHFKSPAAHSPTPASFHRTNLLPATHGSRRTARPESLCT